MKRPTTPDFDSRTIYESGSRGNWWIDLSAGGAYRVLGPYETREAAVEALLKSRAAR